MADADANNGAQFPTEAEIDAVLHEFGGDARAAIGACCTTLQSSPATTKQTFRTGSFGETSPRS